MNTTMVHALLLALLMAGLAACSGGSTSDAGGDRAVHDMNSPPDTLTPDMPADAAKPDAVNCTGVTLLDNACDRYEKGQLVERCCRTGGWCPSGYSCMHQDCLIQDPVPVPCPTGSYCTSFFGCYCSASTGTCDPCEFCVAACAPLTPQCVLL